MALAGGAGRLHGVGQLHGSVWRRWAASWRWAASRLCVAALGRPFCDGEVLAVHNF
jgi:hypothetical protein